MQPDPGAPEPLISVVVASVESSRSIRACVASLVRSLESCGSGRGEILVLDASTDGTAEIVRRRFSQVTVEEHPPGTLVPTLWAHGIERARGRMIALTTGHCTVEPGWSGALVDAMGEGVAGTGGPIDLGKGTGVVDWAVYFLRYSAFLPDGARGDGYASRGHAQPTLEVAADNALYRAEDLRRHGRLFDEGFWEVPYHRVLREEGRRLGWAPEAAATFGPSWPLRTIVAHRYAHGRHFGRWRVRVGGQSPLRVAAPSPLVPMVLALRAGRRVALRPGLLVRFLASLPWFLLLAGGWALGEVRGAWEA